MNQQKINQSAEFGTYLSNIRKWIKILIENRFFHERSHHASMNENVLVPLEWSKMFSPTNDLNSTMIETFMAASNPLTPPSSSPQNQLTSGAILQFNCIGILHCMQKVSSLLHSKIGITCRIATPNLNGVIILQVESYGVTIVQVGFYGVTIVQVTIYEEETMKQAILCKLQTETT